MIGKEYQNTVRIAALVAVALMFIISLGIKGANAKNQTYSTFRSKAPKTGTFSKSKVRLRRPAPIVSKGAEEGGSESLVNISPDDISVEGPVTSYSEENREISIKGENYRLCDNIAVFYQTPKYLRRVSAMNIETAEEARIFIDSRLSCVKELVILKAGR